MVYIRPKGSQKARSDQRYVSVSSLKASPKAQKEFNKGNEALAKNELEKAKKHFQKAVEIYPEYDDAYNGLGTVFLKLNDVDSAAPLFQKALKINAKSEIALTNLARVAISKKDFVLADKYLNQAISLSPLAPQTLSLACQIGVLVGKYDDVVRNARTLHTLPHANMALAHFAAGDSLMRLKRPQEALVEFNLFLSEDPKSRLAVRARESIKEIERILGGEIRSRQN